MNYQLSQDSESSLNTLHTALLLGSMSIILLLYTMSDKSSHAFSIDLNAFFLIGLVVGIATPSVGILLSTKQMDDIQKSDDLDTVEVKIRTAHIIKWAMIESGALINSLFFFMNGNYVHLALAVMLVLVLGAQRYRAV